MDGTGSASLVHGSPCTAADTEVSSESLQGLKIYESVHSNKGASVSEGKENGAGRPAKKSWAKLTNGKSKFGASVTPGKQSGGLRDHKGRNRGKIESHTGTSESPDGSDGPHDNKESGVEKYNPKNFPFNQKGARYFVIKSFCEEDVQYSIEENVWCSSEDGNKKLHDAFLERQGNSGKVYLFFSVNGSGHFCGMAEMSSELRFEEENKNWSQDRWMGEFDVEWIYVKDVPNSQFRHIRLENNENKAVTNSRDHQEVPPEKGRQVVKIINSYRHTTSIFDDEEHIKERREENKRKKEEWKLKDALRGNFQEDVDDWDTVT